MVSPIMLHLTTILILTQQHTMVAIWSICCNDSFAETVECTALHMNWYLKGSKLSDPRLSIDDNGLVTSLQEFWWLEKQAKMYKLTKLRGCHVFFWYLISSDITGINVLSVKKRFKIPKTVLAILLPWHPWPSNLMPPRRMQIRPRECGKHKSGRAHKAFLAPIATYPLGKTWMVLHGNSWFKAVKLFNMIHVGKLSPSAKAVNLLDAFVAAWSFLWSLGLWHSVGSNGKDVRRKGLCFKDGQHQEPFEESYKKEPGSPNLKGSVLWFILMDLCLALFAPKARRKLLPHHKALARTSGANLSRNPMKSHRKSLHYGFGPGPQHWPVLIQHFRGIQRQRLYKFGSSRIWGERILKVKSLSSALVQYAWVNRPCLILRCLGPLDILSNVGFLFAEFIKRHEKSTTGPTSKGFTAKRIRDTQV